MTYHRANYILLLLMIEYKAMTSQSSRIILKIQRNKYRLDRYKNKTICERPFIRNIMTALGISNQILVFIFQVSRLKFKTLHYLM